ncbi:MAG: C1 family peptidase [Legionellaceae bacterium]|nr:C1 family peptidase [Legionellaceae bacterium]
MSKRISIAVLSLSSSLAFATPFSIDGEVSVHITPQGQGLTNTETMQFNLPRIKLSAQAKQYLSEQLQNYPQSAYRPALFSSELPPKVSLGMQGTPVLNQGRHGSCVTFANTAAIDAVLGAGDYISQLCSLELGSWLAINDKIEYSGWNGSWGPVVLDQLMDYGIISKNHEKYQGCAGVQSYPLHDENDEGHPMSEDDYKKYSIPLSRLVDWKPLLNVEQAFSSQINPDMLVWLAKEQLAKGHRLTIGMMLDVNVGHAGALGSYKAANDTWMITPEIISDAVNGDIYAGHELVVTGYDDNAIVLDDAGHENRGVFTLRNSWSAFAGDQGNYYVSYDHFKFFTDEVQVIRLKK